ncbi:hypothetical protein ASPACDRAFT_36236 [Aspergillus aculeatus ATCC 16872]|uniref:Uncharacterized protein n=1 Tax=Aspergillus aculeatus (strain ATCC 16872 / CBS 172.66 / WB 5094) TaxID=690307 RepID=A0A1L9WHB8_ASPA1|nr:uncharacterized protein ASPACDRAFT_36236 [Aspergillus aculeatus ATCC 16872]OJJ95562.1 hypothetical protein ASPACDRAFT_36236 [Aspergillus aculeatus ATCC 16872]
MNPTRTPALWEASIQSSDEAILPPGVGQETWDAELFERLSSYPFEDDHEFAHGLSIILGHPEIPASKAEIVRDDDVTLQAKCFYFSRKEKLPTPVNVGNYQLWLQARPTAAEAAGPINQQQLNSVVSEDRANARLKQAEPAYPSSFAHIVELITTGQPIPGIQQIPDTILAGQDTPSARSRRRKPWELESGKHVGR